MLNFRLKMMNFRLKMMNSVFKMMNSVFKMADFGVDTRDVQGAGQRPGAIFY